jgi:hypothetical protein
VLKRKESEFVVAVENCGAEGGAGDPDIVLIKAIAEVDIPELLEAKLLTSYIVVESKPLSVAT